MRISIAPWKILDWKKQKANIVFRVYADDTFLAFDDILGDGVTVEASPSVFREVTCTVQQETIDGIPMTTVTIPSMWLYSTTDAIINRTARYSAGLYSKSGGLLERLDDLQGFQLPPDILNVTNPAMWKEIIRFNKPAAPVPIDRVTFSREQILALLQQQAISFSGIRVQAADGNPTFNPVTTLEFDEADGFALTQISPGRIRVDLTVGGMIPTIGSSTDNAIVRWDGAGGNAIQNSGVIISDTNNVTGLGTLNTHTIPAVSADTFLLQSASQILANKSFGAGNTIAIGPTMSLGSDADGDIYRRSGGILARLGIGSNGQVLTVVAGAPAWAASAGGSLRVREVDSNPNVSPVTEIVVTNGTLTDNGSGVVTITTGGGGGSSSGVAGSVQFSGGAGAFNSDGAVFFWDNTSKRLGIGTNAPTDPLEVRADGTNDAIAVSSPNGSTLFQIRAFNSAAPKLQSATGIEFVDTNQGIYQTNSIFGRIVFTPRPQNAPGGGLEKGIVVVTPADLDLPSDTENILIQFGGTNANPPVAVTRNFLSANTPSSDVQREYVFQHPNYTTDDSSDFFNATTVAITGAPTGDILASGAQQARALWVQSGLTVLAGETRIGGLLLPQNGVDITGNLTATGAGTFGSGVTCVGLNAQAGLIQGDAGIDIITGTTAVTTASIFPGAFLDAPNAEVTDIFFGLDRTVNFANATTLATQRSVRITNPTFTGDVATKQITVAATVSIAGAPIASTNISIPTALSLWVESGAVRLGTPSSQTGSLQLARSGDANFTTLRAGSAPVSDVIYELPNDDPAAGEQLTVTSFSGGVAVLEWAAAGGGGGGTPGGASGEIQWNNSSAFDGVEGSLVDANGAVRWNPTARTSGVTPYHHFAAPADTGQTANTEFPGMVFGGTTTVGATQTRTGADGTTYALQREYIFVRPTYAFAGATTVTDAITLDITGCPAVGTSATFTRRFALGILMNDLNDGAIYVRNNNFGSDDIIRTRDNGAQDRLIMNRFQWTFFEGGQGEIGNRSTGGLDVRANNIIVSKFQGATNQPTFTVTGPNNQTADLVNWTLVADDTTTAAPIFGLFVNSNGTPGNNFGGQMYWALETTTTNSTFAGSETVRWSNATHASRTSEYILNLVDGAAASDVFFVRGNGQIRYAGLKGQTADVTKTSSTTFSDLTGLTLNLVAGRVYKIRGHIEWNANQSAGNNGGAKITLNGTATFASVQVSGRGWDTTNGNAIAASAFRIGAADGTQTLAAFNPTAATVTGFFEFEGFVNCSASGNIRVQGAQVTSDADSTVFLTGSTFEVWEISNL